VSSYLDYRSSEMSEWEFGKDKVKVIVNVPNSTNGLGAGDVAEVLNFPVFWSLPHDVNVAKASQLGYPVVQENPTTKAAQAIAQLHYMLLGTTPPRSKGLGGLFGRKN
jgi:Flp pilus assembly CpaE family ATPase